MYIFKNAYKTIIRNKGRNILIGLIVMVIAAAVSVTLAIRNSATTIVEAYESQYEVEATIGMNRNNLMKAFRDESSSQEEMIEQFNDIESLSVDEINLYGDSEYVKSFYYKYEISMDAKDLEEATDSLVKETTKTETSTKSWTNPGSAPGMMGGMPGNMGSSGGSKTTKKTTTTEKIYNDKAANGAFSIVGYSSYESMSEFIDGTYTISEGTVFTDLEGSECIISSELATLNELEVGDTIKLVNPDNSKKTYTLTISGIYDENSDNASSMNNMFSNSANQIITTSTIVEKIISDDEDMSVTVTPTYVLTSKEVADDFANEVSEKGLSEYYSVSDNVETVESATKSISNVKTFATTFLIITLIIGVVVLLVINMINIRERKYEIGVLRTIGMKKGLVICQFVFELLSVSIISLLLGCAIGATSSVKIANSLLSSEIENASEQMNNVNKNFGMDFDMKKPEDIEENESENTSDTEETNTEESTDTEKKEMKSFVGDTKLSGFVSVSEVDNINAVVDFKVLLELFGIIVLLSMLSSISACIAISRFSPLDILKERS